MTQRYSIAEARHNLAALVHKLEKREYVELTRRGEPVAILLSIRAYRRLIASQTNFWEAYQTFRQAFPLAQLDIQPEAVFENVRDTSLGREVSW